MTELWRTLLESDAGRRSTTAGRGWRAPWPSSAARRACARSSASGWRGSTRPRRDCSSWPPSPARSSTCRRSRGPGWPTQELRAALEQAIAHGMIEEVPSARLAYRFTHELVRRALYDRMPRLRRAELHLRVAEALEQATRRAAAAAWPSSPTTSAPPRRWTGRERAIEYALLAGPRGAERAGLRRGRGALRVRARARHRRSAPAGRDAARARHRPLPRRRALTTRWRRSAPPRRSPARSATPRCWRRAAVGFEEACWRPGDHRRGRRRAARGGVAGARRRGLRAAGDAARRARRAPTRSWATTRPAASPSRARSRWRGGSTTGFGLATVLVRSYWSRGRAATSSRRWRCWPRRATSPRSWARAICRPRRWSGASPASSRCGDLTAAERELAEVLALAAAPAPAVHAARRRALRLDARAVLRTAGRRRGGRACARTSGAGCSRAATPRARTASRCSGSAASRDAWPSSRPRSAGVAVGRAVAAAPGGPASPRCWPSWGWTDEARAGAGPGPHRRASTRCAPRSGWRRSRYLADACAAVGDDALAAMVYPELAPLAGGNVVIGHGVACYGAADRYLGMLAATLGDHDRAIEHFERALAFNRAMDATTWVAHTLYAYGRTLRIRGGRDDAAQATDAAVGGRGAGRPDRDADAAGPRPRARRRGRRRPGRPPDDLSWREVEILRLVAAGTEQPRDRRGAVHQRAHRRQPRAQHPAQDRRREPHRGGRLRLPPCPCSKRRQAL